MVKFDITALEAAAGVVQAAAGVARMPPGPLRRRRISTRIATPSAAEASGRLKARPP